MATEPEVQLLRDPPLVVRPMEPEDVPQVVRIEAASFSTPWHAETFLSLIGRPGNELWVCTAAGRARGPGGLGTPGESGPPATSPAGGEPSEPAAPGGEPTGAGAFGDEPPDRDVLAYAVISIVLDQAELANIAVREDTRGRRVGSAFLGWIVHRMPRQGVRELFLEVRESNVAARNLYRRHGFEEVGRRRGYYHYPREDALQLVRRFDG